MKAHVPSRTNTTNNGVLLIPSCILVRMNCTTTRMNRKLSKMRLGTLEIKCDIRSIDIFHGLWPYQRLGNSDGMLSMRHALASSVDGSELGVISMDGTATAMIANCAAISATNSVMMKARRVLFRP